MSCGCACHRPPTCDGLCCDDDDGDFACPECGEDLDDNGLCETEGCENEGCEPFIGCGGSHFSDAQHERRMMGITG